MALLELFEQPLLSGGRQRNIELQTRALVGWQSPLAFLGDLLDRLTRRIAGVDRQLGPDYRFEQRLENCLVRPAGLVPVEQAHQVGHVCACRHGLVDCRERGERWPLVVPDVLEDGSRMQAASGKIVGHQGPAHAVRRRIVVNFPQNDDRAVLQSVGDGVTVLIVGTAHWHQLVRRCSAREMPRVSRIG